MPIPIRPRPPAITAAIVSGLLIVSVALNVALVHSYVRQYDEHLKQQVWLMDLPPTNLLAGPRTNSSHTVMFFGDSRIVEWGRPTFDNWQVVNAGLNGQTSAQLRSHLPSVLDTFQPDVVVIQAGINDLKLLGLHPEWTNKIVSLASSNISAMVAECVKRRKRVILLETWPSTPPTLLRRLVWNDAIPNSIGQLNLRLRQIASPENEVEVLDLFEQAHLTTSTMYYRDMLHLKPESYRLLSPHLEQKLVRARPKGHQKQKHKRTFRNSERLRAFG